MAEEEKQQKKEGLSPLTLAIASMASVAAAFFIHEIWQGGAILGAALTPVIVALVSEGLKKPAAALQSTTRTVRTRDGRTVHDPGLPPPPRAEPPEDRFGIWEADKVTWRERLSTLDRKHVKLAIATGLVAFGIAVVFTMGADLVLGGGGDDRFRLVPGTQERSDRDREDRDREQETTTQPAPDEQAPEEEAPAPPTPTTPPEQEPAPTTPAPTTPVPTTPVPPSGGQEAPAP